MKTFTMLMYIVISQDTVADTSIPLPPPPKETFLPRSSEKQQQRLHWKVNNNNNNKKKTKTKSIIRVIRLRILINEIFPLLLA